MLHADMIQIKSEAGVLRKILFWDRGLQQSVIYIYSAILSLICCDGR